MTGKLTSFQDFPCAKRGYTGAFGFINATLLETAISLGCYRSVFSFSDGEHEGMHLQYHTGITVSEDAVLSTYRQETSWKKREQEFFPLVDQLKLQRSLSILIVLIIFEICKLVLKRRYGGEINQGCLGTGGAVASSTWREKSTSASCPLLVAAQVNVRRNSCLRSFPCCLFVQLTV